MTKLLPEDRLSADLAVLKNAPKTAPFIDVAAALDPLTAERNLQRWLTHLVKENQVRRVGSGRAARYRLPDPVSRDVPGGDNSVAVAVRQRVTLPLSERMPVLAPLVSRALVLEDAFDRSTLRKAGSSCGWSAPTPRRERVRPPPALIESEFVACLTEPVARGVRSGVHRVWHIRGVRVGLVNRNPTTPLSRNHSFY